MIDKKSYKLAVVDDKPHTVTEQLTIIRRFLHQQYGVTLVSVIISKQFEDLSAIDDTVDMVIVDKGLGKVSGIDVASSIRQEHRLLDILVYTAGTMGREDVASLVDYGMVEIVNDRRFASRLRRIIERDMSRWEDIVYLRGLTISRIIELEGEVDDTLMEFFSPLDERKEEFRNFFLENPDISLHAKRVVLDQLVKSMDPKPLNLEVLGRLQKKRNLLAHCKRSEQNPQALVRLGKEQEIDKNAINTIFRQAQQFSEQLRSFREAHTQ